MRLITLIHGEGALESVKCEAVSGRPSHEAIDVQLKDFFAKETEARMAGRGESMYWFVCCNESSINLDLSPL